MKKKSTQNLLKNINSFFYYHFQFMKKNVVTSSPPHDCKIMYCKIDDVVKLEKPSISIIGSFIHILF